MSRQRTHRASLAPEPEPSRTPRHSITPTPSPGSRSARNSIAEPSLSPRAGASRNNLAPDATYGSRLSLNPQDFNRSPRNSITPDASARTPRRSLVPDAPGWSQPRNSLVPDVGRSPRHSVASIQVDPSRREGGARTSPRGSIAPDVSPRKETDGCRSSRGSISEVSERQRSPRGSLAPGGTEGSGTRVSPRGSLTLTFQEPLVTRERRASEDSVTQGVRRSVSPYRASVGGGGGGGGGSSRAAHLNLGYSSSGLSDTGSRRASSSVSQVSGDEQRRLCGEDKYERSAGGLGLALTTYGSVAYQLKDANMEATGTCDFVCRALKIVNRTVVMTVFLACLSALPLIMLIMGVQYIRDCPAEPYLPVYMVVGGAAGAARLCWLLWAQLAGGGGTQETSAPERIAAYGMTAFLVVWFGFGNYWILRIKWPDFAPTLFEPNNWCHRTLFVFAMVQLCVVWGVVSLLALLSIALAFCQVFGCGWLGPPRYK